VDELTMLPVERYLEQSQSWPSEGRHVLAQFDETSVIVYQAYREDIGSFAAKHGYFGGAFSYQRMSWIKSNFLWMMYRSGWGTKEGQEVTLAVRLLRSGFDEVLDSAVHSTFVPELYASHDEWRQSLARSEVRLQWDPDHDPQGRPMKRRAIQLGLRSNVLARYGKEWIQSIEDVSEFVRAQSANVRGECENLKTPRERVYRVRDTTTRLRLGVDDVEV
jgi:hypothetical protein